MKILLTLCLISISCLTSIAQLPYDGINNLPLSEYYTYMADSTGNLTANDVLQKFEAGSFQKWEGGVTFNKGIVNKVYWFHLPIKNVTNEGQKAILRLSAKLDDVILYEVQPDGTANLSYETSSFVPFQERPFPMRYICFPINLKAGESKSYLLRVDNRGLGLYMPMAVLSIEQVLRAEQSRHWAYGIYFGMFIFIIIFNIFLYFSLRDKIHIWYSAYVASAILFMVQDERFYTELYPDFLLSFFENAWVPPFSLLLMATSLRVMQLFLEQKRDNSKFYWPTQFVIISCFALSVVMLSLSMLPPQTVILFMRKLYIVTDVLTAFTILLILICAIEKIFQRHPFGVYYLCAVLLMVLGATNYYLNHLGIMNINILKPNGVVVGLAFELTFLSLLLTVRYNNLKREKERIRAEHNIILANAMVQTQENERKRLAQDLHDDLGGTLSGLKLLMTNFFLQKNTAENFQKIQHQVQQLLDKAVTDVRAISHDLMPRDFIDIGIKKSLEELVTRLNSHQHVKFSFVFSGEETEVPLPIQLSVFRIVNELMQNVTRHSQAKTATLQLLIFDNSLMVQMEDDGTGFNLETKKDGIGITSITSRVKFLGGKIDIDSGKAGTTVNIEIPLKK